MGIDLSSEDEAVLVTDTHHTEFQDDHFDEICSGHSVEYAHDVKSVVGEIFRPGALVAMEVPVRYETRGAAMIDSGSGANLLLAFEPHIARVLWCEEHELSTPTNEEGTAIVRTSVLLGGGRR